MSASESSETALITGASTGIGEALAREFARHGDDVVLVARRRERLDDLATELADHGVEIHVLAMDLDDNGAPTRLWSTLEEREIAVDTLVNNVGIGTYGRFAESDLEAERTQLRLNVSVLVELTQQFLDGRSEGAVLNVGSVAGFVPGPHMAGYYASKAYVNSFTQALAAEHRETDIDVTVLCPGPVDTEFQERAGMGDSAVGSYLVYTPEQVARAGYRGLRVGETVVIPGAAMSLLVVLLRFVPRSLQRWGGRLVNGDR
ncbi:NAD(P)-dependent oxidoreductase [Halobacteriales archaeon QS_4_62_28]|nr:MAG: NAD(P)-dependent oxidoreductase [Halobacteriales archaeon QS_4_62_28]